MQAHGEGALPGFVGNFTYSQRNLFGLNQVLCCPTEAVHSTAALLSSEQLAASPELAVLLTVSS